MLARVPPFYHWHTPIAWTGYILLVDAFVWKQRGTSWLRNSPAELLFVTCASVPLWVVFEAYNKYSLRNWYYVGLPDNLALRYLGYLWAFGTIWPAVFETADLVSCLRDRRAPIDRADPPLPQAIGPFGWLCAGAGALMLLLPILLRWSPVATLSRRSCLARLHPAARSAECPRGQRIDSRGLAAATRRAPGQSPGIRTDLRLRLGVLELLEWHQVVLQRAYTSEREDLRDADPRVWRISAVCG